MFKCGNECGNNSMTLTARKVQTAKAGKHSDGNGLFLLVKETGGKSWVLRYQINGRRRDIGLGAYPYVSLLEAREKVIALKKQIKEGFDPLSERQKQKDINFYKASIAFIDSKKSEWKNAKHASQWEATLKTYVYSFIGDINVKNIEVSDIHNLLSKIWTLKPETASRVRGRIESVLDYATALKYRTGENPARWKGNLDHLLPKANKVKSVKHHEALPYQDMTEFMALLNKREGISARALEFLILTNVRTKNVREATWNEIDLNNKIWIIPADKMKADKEHRVPLCDKAIKILSLCSKNSNDGLVFESQTKQGAMLSDMSLSAVLKRMNYNDITVHGFRSTFRDWAGETTAFPREVIEHAMAHKLKDKAEASYARGTLLEKRRELMQAWEKFAFDS